MSRIYKTAKGKTVDMDKVKLSNETAISVGNMRVNARGDLIGPGGEIAQGRNAVMDRAYAVPDGNQGGYSPNDPDIIAQQAVIDASRSKSLHDLANGLMSSTTAEPIIDTINPGSDNNNTTASAKPSRGSLASSVAQPTTVVQQPIADPRKPKGPSRI